MPSTREALCNGGERDGSLLIEGGDRVTRDYQDHLFSIRRAESEKKRRKRWRKAN